MLGNVLLLLLALIVPAPVVGAVRVAVLSTQPDATGKLAALVEAKLLARNDVTLVERQQIDKILRERDVQSALGVAEVKGRASLGNILGADLLLFLHFQEAPQPHFEVMVSDTHQGLRLVHRPLVSADLEAGAAAVERLVGVAAGKLSSQHRTIVAVPPFVSEDLGFECDYLRRACAKLVEAELAQRGDVIVVELEEARALAQEITLANEDDISRPLPYYVMGRYRTDGPAVARKVAFKLELMFGALQLAEQAKKDLPLAEAASYLRETSAQLLAKTAAEGKAPLDSRVEAGQLAERAHLLLTLGSWQESLELIEASLLLKADQPALNREALIAIRHLMGEQNGGGNIPATQRPDDTRKREYLQRGLGHLERFLQNAVVNYDRDADAVKGYMYLLNGERSAEDRLQMFLQFGGEKAKLRPYYQDLVDDVKVYGAVRDNLTKIYFAVLAAKAEQKVVDDTALFIAVVEEIGRESADQVHERNGKVLADFVFHPEAGKILTKISEGSSRHPFNPGTDTGDAAFLNTVRELPNADLTKTADQLFANAERLKKYRLATEQARAAKTTANDGPSAKKKEGKAKDKPKGAAPEKAKAPEKTKGENDVTFTRMSLKIEGKERESDLLLLPILGWVAAGKGIDVVWNDKGLYVMKQAGILRKIADLPPSNDDRRTVLASFDGKYVWVTRISTKGEGHELLVIDPVRESIDRIDASRGLPKSSRLLVTALAPGRAAVVGYFGRTFAAEIKYEPGAAPQIRMLHEFRQVEDVGSKERWRNPESIFEPTNLCAFAAPKADGSPQETLLVWRASREKLVEKSFTVTNETLEAHPVLIDVKTGVAKVIEPNGSEFAGRPRILTRGGAAYLLNSTWAGKSVSSSLRRIDSGGATDRPTGPLILNSISLFEHEGLLHCLHLEGWAVAELDKGPFHPLRVSLPCNLRGAQVCRSEHFGLILFPTRPPDRPDCQDGLSVFQVSFSRPAANMLSH